MPHKIKVMTFNTYLLHIPFFSIGASTQDARINAMIKDNIFYDVDIVILQEVFNTHSAQKLFSGMRSLGFFTTHRLPHNIMNLFSLIVIQTIVGMLKKVNGIWFSRSIQGSR